MKTLQSVEIPQFSLNSLRAHWHKVAYGFVLFFIILWLYGSFLLPALTGPVGGVLSPLGAIAALATTLVIAFVTYWLYAFTIEKVGGEPEA